MSYAIGWDSNFFLVTSYTSYPFRLESNIVASSSPHGQVRNQDVGNRSNFSNFPPQTLQNHD